MPDTPRTTDGDYIRHVRRYRPSTLIPLIAGVGAEYADNGSWLNGDYMRFTPWALSDIARVSLIGGNEYRSDPTRNDLLLCAEDYRNLSDPELGTDAPNAAANFLLRVGYEQQPFGQSIRSEIARNIAILEQTEPSRALKVIRPGWQEELLGCNLSQYAGIGLSVFGVAKGQRGQFSASWFDAPELLPITSHIPVSVMHDVVEHEFTGDRDWYRSAATNEPSPYRRYGFNPLTKRPVVRLNDRMWVPVPLQVIRKISPVGLWYSGFDRWRNAFAEDFGHLFERYVGRVLGTIPDAKVHPEIAYDPDGNKLSVDWIVVWHNVVLLVEVKSTRSTDEIRMGTAEGWVALRNRLAKGYDQIALSSKLIGDDHPKFSHIPKDLPRIGLIVTLEPFPFIDAGLVRDELGVTPSVPMRVCSINDLEWLVCLPDRSVGEHLLELVTDADREGWGVLGQEHAGIEFAPSTILEEAWNAFPWAPDAE
ncbi:hypothetical protein A7R75_20835 [Mycolicibacterium llatzerense]|nr:hypothetical protein [Mycolicibacterium llatzerense]